MATIEINPLLLPAEIGRERTSRPTVGSDFSVAELSELVNLSGAYLTRLLDAGEIASYGTGAHRRIPRAAALTFKAKSDAERQAAMEFLAAEAQELGLGY